MKVHHVIDVLRGKSQDYRIAVPKVAAHHRQGFVEWMDMMADAIAASQHFVFENIPITEDGQGGMDLPGVTEEEREMFSMGLLPLPFPSCWFEAPTYQQERGSEHLAYHLLETEDGFMATPFRIIEWRGMERIIQMTGEYWQIMRGVPGETLPSTQVYDPFGGAALMLQASAEMGNPLDHHTIVAGEVGFLTYLLLMLSSKTTEFRQVAAPEKLNRRRAAKGKAPIPEHRVVSIIPHGALKEYRAQEREMREGRSRASPRIHWRRSHLRQLASGKKVVVARSLVGYRADPEREIVSHSYRVRL